MMGIGIPRKRKRTNATTGVTVNLQESLQQDHQLYEVVSYFAIRKDSSSSSRMAALAGGSSSLLREFAQASGPADRLRHRLSGFALSSPFGLGRALSNFSNVVTHTVSNIWYHATT